MDNVIKWECDCGKRFKTTPQRHRLKYCPGCKDEYVDHERDYWRATFGIRRMEQEETVDGS